jgi:hypothetical protein
MTIAILGAAVLVIGAATVCGIRRNSEGRAQLVEVMRSITPDTNRSALRTLVKRYDHLTLDEPGQSEMVYVLTPLKLDATNWVLRVRYAGDRPISADVRVYDCIDCPNARPEDGPPDMVIGR